MRRHRPCLKIFFDGGARPNPGEIEVAVVAGGAIRIRTGLGHGTSQDAEWLALIEALTVARELGVEAFDLVGDSLAVIRQANGGRIPDASVAHRARFLALADGARPRRIRWITRAQNLAGIALAQRHGR